MEKTIEDYRLEAMEKIYDCLGPFPTEDEIAAFVIGYVEKSMEIQKILNNIGDLKN